MSKRICTAITIFIFSVTMFSEGMVFAATPQTSNNECKNFEKHLEQYESFEQMPAGLQNIYSECDGITVPKFKPFDANDAKCEWVDELGRSRKEWHKDVKDGKLTNLYKRCYSTGTDGFEVDKYSLSNPHPGCNGIINAYEKQSTKKEVNAKGLTKNYKNCTTYGTPYPQLVVPDPSLADLAANLQADGSIRINNDELFTESQTVTLTLAPNAPPEKMQFSNNEQTWSNWEVFTGTKDWLITNNNAGQKTVYVRYKTGTIVSQADSDSIMLLPKYGATYNTTNLSSSWAKSRTQLINVTLKNTGYLTWDSNDPQYPVQLTYKWLAPNGEIAEEYGNYAMFDQTIAYGEVVEVPLLVRAPKTAGNYVLEVDLEEWGVTDFSEMGVLPKKMPITITDEQLPERSTVSNVEALPFGIGGYTALENEPTPEVVTACKSTAILYEMSPDQTAFTVEYIVPYGRTINNVYDVWVDGDNTAFYEIDYNEYLNDSRRLFLYRDSAVESDMCSEEAEQFSNIRECEDLYPDVGGVSNESCLDISKATASKWVSGYQSGDFGPTDLMIRAEFAKLIIGATEIPLLAHPEGVAIFSDIDPNGDEWYKDYAYTAFEAGLMSRDSSGRFSPMTQITFNDAVGVTLSAFDLSLNSCNYSVIYSGNETIGAGLFYGLIEYNKVPASPTLGKISREYAVHMLVNAYAQASHLSANPPLCPKSAGDIAPPADNIKQICGTEQPVKLSSTPSLTRNLGTLLNGVQVEILDAQNLYAHVSVIQTGATGYVSLGEIVPVCDVPTPPMPLVSPDDGGAVVASIVGIYAHIEPSVTTNYVDVNGDSNRNSADIIPYNTKLNVLEVKGNWMRVRFTGTDGGAKEGWVYSGFLVLGNGIVTEQRVPKTMATVDWAHQMTVDLRTDPSENAASIIWETYENTRVQVIEKDDDSPFYFVKIEVPSRDLSNELIEENYGRLYMGMADLSQLNSMAIGLSGWVHEEFMNEDGVNYPTPLAYPFDYNAEIAVDNLVNQIFYEEVMGEVHGGIDYALNVDANVLAVASGTIIVAQTDIRGSEHGKIVVVQHSDGKFSYYGHLNEINVEKGQSVGQRAILGTSGHHLHYSLFKSAKTFELKTEEALNPTKYIGNYNSFDSNICMRELIVDLGMRDGELIADICNTGIGEMPEDVTKCAKFYDVGAHNTYCPEITYAKENNWIDGYGDGTFGPDDTITRAQALKIVTNAHGIDLVPQYWKDCDFVDVDGLEHWGESYICYAKSKGWINGYKDNDGNLTGYFGPDDSVTVSQLAKIALHSFGFDENKACWEVEGQEWFQPYMSVLAYNGVDLDGDFDANNNPDNLGFHSYSPRDFSVYLIKSVLNLENKGSLEMCPALPFSMHGPWMIFESSDSISIYDREEFINKVQGDSSILDIVFDVIFADITLNYNGSNIEYEADVLKSRTCHISKGEFYRLLNHKDYHKERGIPCLDRMQRTFGDYTHQVDLYTKGAIFEYDGISYWEDAEAAKYRLEEHAIENDKIAEHPGIIIQFNDLVGSYIYVDDKANLKFVFSEVLGTYIYHGVDESLFSNTLFTVYYLPKSNDEGKDVVLVDETILDKLEQPAHFDEYLEYLGEMCNEYGGDHCALLNKEEDRVVSYLGYPLKDEMWAAKFEGPNTEGKYQPFTDGSIYNVDQWGDSVYYVPGVMDTAYDEAGGTKGIPGENGHGFPQDDPRYDIEDDVLIQEFENGSISVITQKDINGDYITFTFHQWDYKHDPQAYFNGLSDQFFEEEIWGIATNVAGITAGYGLAKSKLMSKILKVVIARIGATKAGTFVASKAVPVLGWIVLGASAALTAHQAADYHSACTDHENYNFGENNPDADMDPMYWCGRRDAVVIMVGLGYGIEKVGNVANRIATSVFGGLTTAARKGSKKVKQIVEKVGEVSSETADDMVKTYNKVLRDDPGIDKVMRNKALEEMEKLSDADIEKLLKNKDLLRKYVKKKSFGYTTTDLDVTIKSPFGKEVRFRNQNLVDEAENIKLLDNIDGLTDEQAELLRIQGITQPNTKGQKAESFMQRLLGKNDDVEDWSALGTTRKTDVWDDSNKISHEVKMWKNNVPNSGLTEQQVLKDIELMRIHKENYTPVWHFLEKGPNDELKRVLEDNGIQYIIYKY